MAAGAKVSVEIPAFKGGWLQRCIDSVLYQSSPHWRLSVVWDGGDEESRRVLEALDRRRLPNVQVFFNENQGIARARRFLSEHSEGDYILPLDDDDALPFNAVERFLRAAEQRPWASVIRAKRKFIDEEGKVVHAEPWFAFEPRHYQYGMVRDVSNHSQPYLISRAAYDRTSGWEGFADFQQAGEDCDIYLKLEETGAIELLDEVLYYYRINGDRASLVLTDEAAFEMWRRLADKTIERTGIPVRRVTDEPPFDYERVPRAGLAIDAVDFVVMGASPEAGGSLAANRSVAALGRSGVAADAIRVVVGGTPAALNRALAETSRAVVCMVDAAVDLADRDALEGLLEAMTRADADLASPRLETEDGFTVYAGGGFGRSGRPEKLRDGAWRGGERPHASATAWLTERFVLVRREVAAAVGGFDEGYRHARHAMVDFCLKARQREFSCVHLGRNPFVHHAPEPSLGGDADLRRLAARWRAHPALLRSLASDAVAVGVAAAGG